MSVSEKGRFCSSCRKEVQDFSNSSSEEIKAAYFENKGELCGHLPVKFLQEQHFEYHLQKSHYSHLKKFFIAAVFCFGASLFSIAPAKASAFYKLKLSFLSIAENDVKVTGVVRDKDTREALPFVNVAVLYQDSIITVATTDIDGKYAVMIPKEYSKVDIKVTYIAYVTKIMKAISIAPGKQIVVDFDMQADEVYLTDGIMIYEEPLIKDSPGSSGKTIKKDEFKRMPK
jgi:hypothetical protein